MPLVELWKSAPSELVEKHIQQVIGFAGDGKLRDGGTASKELRDFLAQVPSKFLVRYADECLNQVFDGNGFALQDVINEVGRRLSFKVEYGRYRGTQASEGSDRPFGHFCFLKRLSKRDPHDPPAGNTVNN